MEWSCTCFASAGPFDARIDTSNTNNCTPNAIAIPSANVDDCIHPNAIPDANVNNGTYSDANDCTYPNANNGTYPNTNDGTYSNTNNCAYSDANDGGTHPNTNALPDGHADDFNIAIGIPYTLGIWDSGASFFHILRTYPNRKC